MIYVAYLCVDTGVLVIVHLGSGLERVDGEPKTLDTLEAKDLVESFKVVFLRWKRSIDWEDWEIIGGSLGVQELRSSGKLSKCFPRRACQRRIVTNDVAANDRNRILAGCHGSRLMR